MKDYNIIIFSLMLCASCATRLVQRNLDKVTSFTADKLYFERNGDDHFYVYDLSGLNTISYSLIPEQASKVVISQPSLVFISNAFYIIYPGENIQITNNEKEKVLFNIEGNEQRNNEFNYQFLLDSIKMSLRPRIYDSLQYKSIDSILDFEDSLNAEVPKYLKRMHKASDSLASLLKIRDSFKIFANANLENETISIKSQFNFTFQNKLKANNLYLPKQELILKLLNEIKNPYQITFYGYNYIDDVARDLIPKGLRRLENENELITNIDILNLKFQGIARDYILGKQMLEYIRGNANVSSNLFDYYIKKSTSTGYNSIIKNIVKDHKDFAKQSKGLKSNRLVEASNLKITTLDKIIESEKGKLILFDFWATWCKPCMEQMGEWKKLKDDYKDKNIVFINISFDTDLKAWQRKNETLGFDLKKSFVLENKFNQAFIKLYDISTIPRLILFDKNGNLINSNTPEPGDTALRKLIDEKL